MNVKILVADDHVLVLKGLQSVLEDQLPNAEVILAQNLPQLTQCLKESIIHVLIQDIKFGKDDARTFLPEILLSYPQLKVIALTSLDDAPTIQTLMNSGCHGFVLKSEGAEKIVKAIETVQQGEIFLSPQSQKALFQTTSKPIIQVTLSQRENEILQSILQEMTSKEIGEKLFISDKTVEHYRAMLFSKFDVKNVTGLVKKAILNGYWED